MVGKGGWLVIGSYYDRMTLRNYDFARFDDYDFLCIQQKISKPGAVLPFLVLNQYRVKLMHSNPIPQTRKKEMMEERLKIGFNTIKIWQAPARSF